MKTIKYISNNKKWFSYRISTSLTNHGLFNDYHDKPTNSFISFKKFGIGYHYQDEMKGFWLEF